MSIEVKLGRDEATAAVAEVHAKLTSPGQRIALMKHIGQRANEELQHWFHRRDAANPNKMGWPRKHFWRRIEEATAFDSSKTTENTATVDVADPALAAKVNGATIRPRPPHRALAIPMSAEAYAAGPPGNPANSAIPGMFVFRSTHTNGAYLVRRDGPAGQHANLTFLYRLVPEVTVPKDPQALPPTAQLGAALSEAATAFFLRQS